MTKRKATFIMMTAIWLAVGMALTGCDSLEKVGECGFAAQSVTQNSRDGYVTFTFEIPEGWIPYETSGYRSVGAFPKNRSEGIHLDRDYDVILGISCYTETTGDSQHEERMNTIEQLFQGNSAAYEEFTKRSAGAMDSDITADGFTFRLYNGRYGRIAAVEYTVTYPGKYEMAPQHIIRCYRQDIDYMTTGMFHEGEELSSGDIALWAANTLQVTEHFTIQDGQIVKMDFPGGVSRQKPPNF